MVGGKKETIDPERCGALRQEVERDAMNDQTTEPASLLSLYRLAFSEYGVRGTMEYAPH